MSRRKKPRNQLTKQPSAQSAAGENKKVTVTTSEQFSGPIPRSTELANYDAVVPGAAERIIRMAEKNQDHQIDIEGKALDAQKWEGRIGQIFALVISLAAFGTAIAAMVMGYAIVAAVIGGTTVVSLAIAFITGRKMKE